MLTLLLLTMLVALTLLTVGFVSYHLGNQLVSTPKPTGWVGEKLEKISCGSCKSELPSEALPSRFESFDLLQTEPLHLSLDDQILLFSTTHGLTVTPFECPVCGPQKHIVYTTLSFSHT